MDSMQYLDLGGCSQHDVVWVLQTLLFAVLRLGTNQQAEMCGQVAAQQRLVGGDVQQQSHRLHVEPRLQNLRRGDSFRRGQGGADAPWRELLFDSAVSPSGLHARRCLSGSARIRRGPRTAATPSPCGWSIERSLPGRRCSVGAQSRRGGGWGGYK